VFGENGNGLSAEIASDAGHRLGHNLPDAAVTRGFALSANDVYQLLLQREGVRNGVELVVSRDDKGRPRAARRIVHRGGVLKKSLLPVPGIELEALEAEGGREKLAGWLLRASGCVAGAVAQAVTIQGANGAWIPDYAVVTAPFSIVLVEVKASKYFGIREQEKLREDFAAARMHGLKCVLWTDTWLRRNALISNASYLHKFREHHVDESIAYALIALLERHAEVALCELFGRVEPLILHSVYALIAQGRIHVDLGRPMGDWVLSNAASQERGLINGKDQLFDRPELSSGW